MLDANLIEDTIVGLGLTGNADRNVRLREVMAALEVGVVWLADVPGDESRQRTVSIMLAGLVAYLRGDDDADRPRPALRLVKGGDDQPALDLHAGYEQREGVPK